MKKILTFVLAISLIAILAACSEKEETLTDFKTVDNKYQVTASDKWEDAEDMLHSDSELQIYDPTKEKYFVALLEAKEDFTDTSLQTFYDLTAEPFISSLENPEQGDVKEITINGNNALQYTLQGSSEGVNVAYLVTLIETPTHFGQLLTWTVKSDWEEYKDEFTNLVNTFKEVE